MANCPSDLGIHKWFVVHYVTIYVVYFTKILCHFFFSGHCGLLDFDSLYQHTAHITAEEVGRYIVMLCLESITMGVWLKKETVTLLIRPKPNPKRSLVNVVIFFKNIKKPSLYFDVW